MKLPKMKLPKMKLPKMKQSTLNTIILCGIGITLLLATLAYFKKVKQTEGFEGGNDWELTTDGSAVALQYKKDSTFKVTEDGQIDNPMITEMNKKIDELTKKVDAKAAVGAAGTDGVAGTAGPQGPPGPKGDPGAAAEADAIPKGTIVAYQGSKAPDGWAFCDGKGGTPNLKDKFILGWGDKQGGEINATGGSDTISINQMPAHKHDITDPGHTHSISWSSHNDYGTSMHAGGHVSNKLTGSSKTGITMADAGSGAQFLPPYYRLAYIIKL